VVLNSGSNPPENPSFSKTDDLHPPLALGTGQGINLVNGPDAYPPPQWQSLQA
jgi:hypothetical protein